METSYLEKTEEIIDGYLEKLEKRRQSKSERIERDGHLYENFRDVRQNVIEPVLRSIDERLKGKGINCQIHLSDYSATHDPFKQPYISLSVETNHEGPVIANLATMFFMFTGTDDIRILTRGCSTDIDRSVGLGEMNGEEVAGIVNGFLGKELS